MSRAPPSPSASHPRRGTQRESHLRQVSNGSPESLAGARPLTALSNNSGTNIVDAATIKPRTERRCALWIHDEAFSKEDVILNIDLFPDLQLGSLVALVALNLDSGVRDFAETVSSSSRDLTTLSTAIQHEHSESIEEVSLSGSGIDAKQGADIYLENRYLFIAKDMPSEIRAKQPNLEISVAKHIAEAFALKHRANVVLAPADLESNSASHVELSFKDEYLARSDMWRLSVSELCRKTVYKGQKILFMGTIKAQVTSVYVNGRNTKSAFFSTNTRAIFRSGSARYVLFIQMSREMWDFDSEGSGEIMFNKVINGFLPALFKKWASLKVKHLVSIVLFTRVEYDVGIASELATDAHDSSYHTGIQADGNRRPYKDFYRVVVSEMASGSWTTILYQLKREFKFFRKDISLHRIDTISSISNTSPDRSMRGALGTRIEAEPSLAMHGNVLEAINLAASQFAYDYIDRDLMRTGISIVVITPGPGLFEVNYESLRMTTETLINNGIGIDLVCLPKMPLHSVPLFRYRNPHYGAFQEALHFKELRSEDSTPRQSSGIFGSSFSSLTDSLSPTKALHTGRSVRIGSIAASTPPSEWSYAIPHWIDVSFWTGASQDTRVSHNPEPNAFKYSREAIPHRSIEFAVRCKMYEMEMASIMENSMTEIAISPLPHDALFPQMITGSREIPGQKFDENKSETTVRGKTHADLIEFVGGPLKSVLDRNSSQEDKRLYQALDTFDITRGETVNDRPKIGHSNESNKSFKTGSEEASRKVLAEDPKVFGTSLNDDLKNQKSINMVSGPIVARSKKIMNPGMDAASSIRENSNTSELRQTVPRPPKIGRQISLGKYGFGIAAPKAAVAEIQTEHASAAKPTSSVPKTSGSKHNQGSVTTQLFSATTMQTQDRPSSSRSESLRSSVPISETITHNEEGDPENSLSARPMTIKSALQSLDSTNQFKSRSVLGSLYEEADQQLDLEFGQLSQSVRLDDSQKLYNSKLLAGAVPELPTTLSPTTALSPWLSVVNPSNPFINEVMGPNQYKRWQHLFPRPASTKSMKWKSLCSPASVPLTTEYFPTKYQLETEYQQKPYTISQNTDDESHEILRTREEFLRDLIGLRLSQGFQIVVGPAVSEAFGQKSLKIANVFDQDCIAEDGTSVFMSMGNIIHQLSCVNEAEVEVKMFIRKPTVGIATGFGSVISTLYNPAIRTILAEEYQSRQIVLGRPRDEYNWNYVDAFIAGFDEKMSDNLRFWRARFVLIPVERPNQLQRHGEDNEEEIRLEGIRKLTQMWQRHRIVTAYERRFQIHANNPLDIVYRTEDPSIVVSAELETLPLVETGDIGQRRGQLLEFERFRKSKFDIAALANAIQAPVERGGIRMQNRRWHFRLHYNCFIGTDMTTWLYEHFEDIQSREEAVEFGNMLMAKDDIPKLKEKEVSRENGSKDLGIFVHVEKRHPFRDGQYFYQITGEHAKQRPESRSGWFVQKRKDTSIPSTPMTESISKDYAKPERSKSSSNQDEKSSDSGTTTPTTAGGVGMKPRVALSKVIKYDVDHRKRSYRSERINLHYDRLHNPDNCYHIRIDWMSVTAKLIEDAVESWASTAERYGLRLVEAPIGEASSITSVHPFRSPYTIELALQPPERQPRTYYDTSSFAPQVQSTLSNRHYYQKAIMKKFNFVLDIEAARNFPTNVEVTYSWGRPDFKYTQYIHRSGVLLAQITDDGNFLLLANRLYNSRTPGAREWDKYAKNDHGDRNSRMPSSSHPHDMATERPTPIGSPILQPATASIGSPLLRAACDVMGHGLAGSKIAGMITPESIKSEMEAFCGDISQLEHFYKDVYDKAIPPNATPPNLRNSYPNSLLDSNIPALGLPPGVLARDTSPSPMRTGNSHGGIGSPLPAQIGRRPSVQIGNTTSGENIRQDSPRGSIVEE